ncbi:hypothetical protein [Simkania sp.]|uniref:hypothetical protein n=1 Tax=Simkania sp. TaxID=34094 RepID=UPI003B52394E
MATPVGLAAIFGPILLIIGVWTLLYQENVKKMSESIKKTPGIMYIGGVINLIIGLTVINISPQWQLELSVLVTIFGWVCFLRGLIIFFLPNLMTKVSKAQTNTFLFFGLLSVVWGLALCWLAYL